MVFMNSLLYFSYCWKVGFLPPKQKQYEMQLSIIKSNGSQLSTEYHLLSSKCEQNLFFMYMKEKLAF